MRFVSLSSIWWRRYDYESYGDDGEDDDDVDGVCMKSMQMYWCTNVQFSVLRACYVVGCWLNGCCTGQQSFFEVNLKLNGSRFAYPAEALPGPAERSKNYTM